MSAPKDRRLAAFLAALQRRRRAIGYNGKLTTSVEVDEENNELVRADFKSHFGPVVLFMIDSDMWLDLVVFSTNRRRHGKNLLQVCGWCRGVAVDKIVAAYVTTANSFFSIDDTARGAAKKVELSELWTSLVDEQQS